MSDFERIYGPRVTTSLLYDSLETFFHEGGAQAYVGRVMGPSPVTAFVNLLDGAAAQTLKVSAKSAGVWGNNLTVQVTAGGVGGSFVLTIRESGTIVETSPDLLDQAAAIAWGANSNYVVITALASALDPAVVGATALTTGSDGGAATDATWLAALNLFVNDLGTGQVSMPGRTTDTAHLDLLTHAKNNNRTAIMDAVDSATKATHIASAAALRTNGRYGGLFEGWVIIPGLLSGTTRVVPPSALVAGAIARLDLTATPNEPAAGVNGEARYCVGINHANYSDTDRQELNNAGVNVIRSLFTGVTIYGWRTCTDPLLDTDWISLGNTRLNMGISADADLIGENFVFRNIDGRGVTIGQFGGALTAMLMDYYSANALYGDTPEDAFNVDVGPQVNTPTTIANRELRASLSVRMSEFAELVTIEVVKVAITEAVV
jgi:hypothetical protein